MQLNPVTPKHLLSKRAVLKQIPISGATLARRVAAGAFPRHYASASAECMGSVGGF